MNMKGDIFLNRIAARKGGCTPNITISHIVWKGTKAKTFVLFLASRYPWP